jgi:L-iditol 2-dehydrogenase
MKVGLLAGPGRLSVEERPAPTAGTGELVVELAACGVCGTDLEKVRGHYQTAGRLGHEPVGLIAEVGEGVSGFRVGQRVFVHHHVPCLRCEVCLRGDLTFCSQYSTTNIDPGGFAERFRVPSENVERGAVLLLDPSVDWEVGTLLEPAACARTALRQVGFRAGDTVFIIGLGPVGLLYAAVALALGASWVGGSDLSRLRRETAEKLGVKSSVDPRAAGSAIESVRAATGARGVDLSVVATGASTAVALGCTLPRRGGTMNLFGLPGPDSRLDTDLQQLYLRGIKVVPTYATTEPDIAEVHRLLVERRLDLRSLVSHRFPVERTADAFDQAARADEALKVIVTGPAYGR